MRGTESQTGQEFHDSMTIPGRLLSPPRSLRDPKHEPLL